MLLVDVTPHQNYMGLEKYCNEKTNHIIKEGGSFLSPNATPEEIEEAGKKLFV